eukprot:gb/GEZN01002728.1/.p1 GENE.gb/GEZN01002728.1/~~gb/GEZN01002728.1/.p1  ORF type:complete len:679 (+),score=84.71 gb/GEZN01002728.1/:302-2338(+)
MLTTNKSLQTLRLDFAGLGADGCVALARGLVKHAGLTSLSLSYNKFGNIGMAHLAQAFLLNTTLPLLEINLSWNHIGPQGLRLLPSSFPSTLQSLDLSGNAIGPRGCSFLTKDLLKVSTHLKEITLWRCSLGDLGAQYIASGLRINTSLRWLNLRCNEIGEKGGIALAKSLYDNPANQLVSLDLWNNNLGSKAACAFGALLRARPETNVLTVLNLRGNPLLRAGGCALVEGLASNRTLRWLDVRRCALGVQGIKGLDCALHENTTLTYLDLSQNGLGGGDSWFQKSGTNALSDLLSARTSLMTLNLQDNSLSSKCMAVLARSVQDNKTLLSMCFGKDLDSNLQAKQAIQQALSRNVDIYTKAIPKSLHFWLPEVISNLVLEYCGFAKVWSNQHTQQDFQMVAQGPSILSLDRPQPQKPTLLPPLPVPVEEDVSPTESSDSLVKPISVSKGSFAQQLTFLDSRPQRATSAMGSLWANRASEILKRETKLGLDADGQEKSGLDADAQEHQGLVDQDQDLGSQLETKRVMQEVAIEKGVQAQKESLGLVRLQSPSAYDQQRNDVDSPVLHPDEWVATAEDVEAWESEKEEMEEERKEKIHNATEGTVTSRDRQAPAVTIVQQECADRVLDVNLEKILKENRKMQLHISTANAKGSTESQVAVRDSPGTYENAEISEADFCI